MGDECVLAVDRPQMPRYDVASFHRPFRRLRPKLTREQVKRSPTRAYGGL